MELASLAQLERHHRRHDDVMAGLVEAARRFAAGRPDADDLERVRSAIQFFERDVTRHFLDEEGSLFPRLSTRRPALAAQLSALADAHHAQVQLQADVSAAARGLGSSSRPGAGKYLLEAVGTLADAHAAHVATEDALLTAAASAFTAEDDREILAEMETRRDRDTRPITLPKKKQPTSSSTKPKKKPSKPRPSPSRSPAAKRAAPRRKSAR
ncbi:MAG TPA: hemerythrin domain-containing protein [Kofleriaceae bacterium]|jgi:hypothetical protein